MTFVTMRDEGRHYSWTKGCFAIVDSEKTEENYVCDTRIAFKDMN